MESELSGSIDVGHHKRAAELRGVGSGAGEWVFITPVFETFC